LIELAFYTTDDCHLCEEAKILLQQLLAQFPKKYQIEMIDIIESDALVEQYGTRIPVVVKEGQKSDLGWPFDYANLQNFVEANSAS
jgi:thiol-disulfide isomerase/thioredoxin